MTSRPGWSVARLARESGIHRGTIFKWLAGKGGVTVGSVRTVAGALGDDLTHALRAAGNAEDLSGTVTDEELAAIAAADLDDEARADIARLIVESREEDRRRREAEVQRLIAWYRRHHHPDPEGPP
jgi:transcriptional regulator with XRE-family HTH domain